MAEFRAALKAVEVMVRLNAWELRESGWTRRPPPRFYSGHLGEHMEVTYEPGQRHEGQGGVIQ